MPAIDILDGKCVRLKQGDYGKSKIYSRDPTKMARKFIEAGAGILHVVDLDGALRGKPANKALIYKLAKLGKIEVGGGIRDLKTAKKYFDNGVERIVLGTKAITDFKLIKDLINAFGSEKVCVALDIKNEKLATSAWRSTSKKSPRQILEKLKKIGVKIITVTDTSRDGMLKGPNFKLIKSFVRKGLNVIAAGGITSFSDLEKLKKIGVYGAIIGKAIYEGEIDLQKIYKRGGCQSNLAKRIIPCMDIANGRVVKGIGFKNLRDAGDPVKLGHYYSKSGADELVFLDITASIENRRTFCELVRKIAEKINIPFTVGGGIRTVDDIRNLLNAGADKVSIGIAAVLNPQFIKKAARRFGSQCIVISLDCKKDTTYRRDRGNVWKIYIKGGHQKTNIDAVNFAKKMDRLGAGELLINSLDRDGKRDGYDIELLRKISEAVNIPVIASSGANSAKDFLQAFTEGKADSALAASIFHYGKTTIGKVKKYLVKNNVTVRI